MTLAHVPKRPSLADATIAALRAQITSGAWAVGTRIPTEPTLVEQLGVARNTVREAVRALTHTGLLEVRQGSGTYVVATSEIASLMGRRFADADPQHLNEFRAALEGAAAGLAAQRRTADDLRRLDAALRRRVKAWDAGDPAGFAAADASFHLTMVAAAHNDVLTEIYADLTEVVGEFIRAELAGVEARAFVDHDRLVEAIRERRPDDATAEAGAHAVSWRPAR